MTKEEAIKYIRFCMCEGRLVGNTKPIIDEKWQAGIMAIEALKQDPCEDAVSRQAVIDEIEFFQINPQHFDFVSLIDNIKDLPSVNPQKVGHWIIDKEKLGYYISKCSACGHIFLGNEILIYRPKYCANCGAKMIEPQESEE